MRALIVDDSCYLREHLRDLLEEKGIEVEVAADGRDGLLQLHASDHFDLALVDWNMPVMGGFEMLEHMRAEGFNDVKVMIVTAETEDEFIRRSLEAGADEYLMKPFDEDSLTEKLAMLGFQSGSQES